MELFHSHSTCKHTINVFNSIVKRTMIDLQDNLRLRSLSVNQDIRRFHLTVRYQIYAMTCKNVGRSHGYVSLSAAHAAQVSRSLRIEIASFKACVDAVRAANCWVTAGWPAIFHGSLAHKSVWSEPGTAQNWLKSRITWYPSHKEFCPSTKLHWSV